MIYKEKELLIPIEDELKDSYLSYALSVIISRALPDVRDGLKPVQRRILYSMKELGNLPNSPFKKSARVVGETLGKYHPHGDAPVYEALVRMAQDFTMRYPLVEGQGNFGSLDGDPPAAMRYTEVRLAPISLELLSDLEKETVPFRPNFDSTLLEPEVLPAKIPNILLNGATGIAVGMATNIPPHNLNEVIDALLLLLKDREKNTDEILKVLKGPDFPTRGVILNIDGIKSYFETGRGSIIIKGKGKFEKIGKTLSYIIYEIPYNVNKANLIKRIVELVKNGKLKEIDDIRDESSKEGIRIVIELKKNVDTNVFEKKLYEYTELKTSFPVNFVALINGRPKLLSIKEVLISFLEFREEIITKRTLYELREEKRELKILTGIKKGIDRLDEVIEIIKGSKDIDDARKKLNSLLDIDDEQSNAILDMRLARLMSIEVEKLIKDIKTKEENIKRLNEILTKREALLKVIEEELIHIKKRYGDDRKTEIKEEKIEELSIKDIIQDEKVIVFLTNDGYIKRTNLESFITQNRGGKGVKGITLGREDEIADIYFTSTHKNLYLFTDFGKAYSIPVYQIPEGEKKAKGEALHILLPLHPDERVTSVYTGELNRKYLFLFTSKGKVKMVDGGFLKNLRRNGVKIISLGSDDSVKRVRVVNGEENIVVITKKGNMAKFSLKKLRPQGRGASGVRGLKLKENDEIASFDTEEENKWFFIVTQKGKGKRIDFKEISLKNRGISGMRGIKLKNDCVVAVRNVSENDDIFIVTKFGKVIRIKAKEVPIQKRTASGVKLINTDTVDEVRGIAVYRNEKI